MTLPTLLEPLEINHMTLKNRIIFPPMTTGYEARDGSITEQSINFYKRVAEGGASYIVLGDVTPVHTISPTPKLVNDDQIPSFKALADALHEFDCKLGLQVFHPEYDTVAVAELFAKGDMAGARAKLHHDMQHYINEVTGERLQEILGHITALARRATQAGADAIEVHGDRLVGSLCSPLINQRTDEYGGSFENRTRFARAVVRAIREGSPDICIDYKLPIITEDPQLGRGGLFIDEAVELAKLLEADGVDTFHVGQANHTGNLNDTIPAMGTRPECFMAPYARRIKEAVSVPVSTVGRIMTPEDGYEYKRVITPAGTPRKIAVVGGGPAGMEAARVAALRGHDVTLYEKTDHLGGQLGIAAVPPRKDEMNRATRWYERAVAAAGVTVLLNTEATPERLIADGVDEVIVAVGGRCATPPIEGVDMPHVMDSWKVLAGEQHPQGRVVVIGGGLVGAETAEYIAQGDCEVTIVEMMGQIAAEESSTVKPFIMEDFTAHNVVVKTNTKVDRITADAVEATETLNPPAPTGRPGAPAPVPAADAPEPETQAIGIPCDCVVIASGTAPVTFDTAALEEHGIKVTLVGDCNGKAADINRAVEEGYLAATAA